MTQVTLAEEGLDTLFGTQDENLRRIERTFGVDITARGNELHIHGEPEPVERVRHLLAELGAVTDKGYRFRPGDVQTAIRVVAEAPESSLVEFFFPEGMLASVRRLVAPRSFKQQLYIQSKWLTPFLFLLLAAWGAGASAAPRPRPVVVGIVGDQTLSHDIEASYKALERGVGLLAARRPDVVLHTGDLVESSDPPEKVRASYARAAGLLGKLPAPWYLTPGDHDVNPPVFKTNSGDRSREALFQELYGARVPAFRQRPYYSFDVRGVHFVALDSQEVLHADPRWGNVFFAHVSDRQLAWLGQDLEAHRRARAVVVFLHQPLWYHWSGWRQVHALLRRYPVAAVVAGHLHYSQDEGEIDGIRYLTVGATGGDTKEGSPNAGNLQAVTLLRVKGRHQVEVELLPLRGGSSPRLTPREDMDRVQALDVQLGNLWDFSARNPVFVKDGRLVGSCKDGTPARVRIDQIGNPIDLPLDLAIDFHSEPATVALEAPGFSADACPVPQGGGECLLTPGARTEISNDSSVTIQGLCPCAVPSGPSGPALWEAALVPAAGAQPAPGTVLRLHLRTGFQGTSGNLFLEKTVQTTVAACP